MNTAFFIDNDRFTADTSNETAEYKDFVEKFKPKKTTDDCYTPDLIYKTVAEWVEGEYGVPTEQFVRPFYPGGDYENFAYPIGAVVVDNPPFSILTEIVRFYCNRKIKFFLFAPALTPFVAQEQNVSYVLTGATIEYGNGAKVNTSFVTNLDGKRIRSTPKLYQALKCASEELRKEKTKQHPKYRYPNQILTATDVNQFSKYGVDFSLHDAQCRFIWSLNEQRKAKKNIFGGGWLLSEKAAAEKAAAEKAAAEKAAATVWKLDEEELNIVHSLGDK